MLDLIKEREREKENPMDRFSALNFSPKGRGIQSENTRENQQQHQTIPCFPLKIHVFFAFSASADRGKKKMALVIPLQGKVCCQTHWPIQQFRNLKALSLTARATSIATVDPAQKQKECVHIFNRLYIKPCRKNPGKCINIYSRALILTYK